MERAPVSESAWLSSPCSSCGGSPCCRHLPLNRWRVETRADLEYALELLERRGVEVDLCDNGSWVAYYRRACRFLQPEDSRCGVHGSAVQPWPCRDYSALHCWYRRSFRGDGSSGLLLRFDRRRLEAVAERVRFDPGGAVAEVPEWEELRALASVHPLDLEQAPPADVPEATPPRLERTLDPSRTLVFPLPRPWKRSHLELILFRLGFPGVHLAVTDSLWFILVEAPCRGRTGTAAGGGAAPDRKPAPCRMPWRYTGPVGVRSYPHPDTLACQGFVRLGLEAFRSLTAVLPLQSTDPEERIESLPGREEVRRRLALQMAQPTGRTVDRSVRPR